jgi:hypothetical protein
VVVALAQAAVFVILFAVAKTSPSVIPLYVGLAGLYGLGVGIWMLVSAFRESIGTGFLCLCVPFYSLYFVFAKCGNPYLSGATLVSVAAGVLQVWLTYGMASRVALEGL